jgi:hypothetical protein
VGLVVTLWFWNSRRRTTVVSQSQQPVRRPDGTYVDEYRETRRDDPPAPY